MPALAWGIAYMAIFEKHQDRIASYVMAAFSAIVLWIGVAHSIKRGLEFSCLFSFEMALIFYWLLVACMAVPVVFVLLGRNIIKWSENYASSNVSALEKIMQGAAQDAALKAPNP